MKKSDEVIIKIVDTFDEVSKIYYNEAIDEEKDNTSVTNYNIQISRTNYYECLIEMIDYYLGNKELNISEDALSKIDELFSSLDDVLCNHMLTNEEMRRALLLLDINGFKHLNYPLDYITPDVVSVICNHLIQSVYNKEITILDFNFGVGNLAFYIANNLKQEVKLIGIENHSLLVNVSAHKADMMERELVLYHQDALECIPNSIDVVVSDIATHDYENPNYHSSLYDQNVRYFPYLAIERYLELDNNPLYIYIIDNNFFEKEGSNKFKELIKDKAKIISLVALPENFFIDKQNAKSLLIMKKSNDGANQTNSEVFVLPQIDQKDAFMKTIDSIVKVIKKEMNN